MQTQTSDVRLEDVYTISDFVVRYPQILRGDTTEAKIKSLYWLIFKADSNGLAESGAILGKHKSTRVIAPKFLDWLLSQSRHAA